MNIALIFPRYKYPSGDVPLGISYIASYLREKTNYNIEILDATFDGSFNKLKSHLISKKYDIVGISAMTTMIEDAFKVAKILKTTNPSTLVVMGGPHPTVMPELTLKNQYVDAVCVGEGEATWLDLLEHKGEMKGINGIWYKENGNVIKNPPRDPIKNLDKLPYPAFDLLPMNKYFEYWFQLDSVKRDLKGVNIICSRGCPYNCTYCQPTLFKLFGKKIRKRSAKNIVEEVKYWKKKYNINAFMFQDDTFIFDKQWVSEICDELIKSNLNLIWGCNARANLVDKELFRKMKKAGLRKVFIGIESGSQRILDKIYHKGITLQQVKNAVKIFKELNLKVQGYFMMGAPTETIEEINKTIKFAKNLDIDEATFSITTPLPATYLYNKTKHLITKDISEFDYYKTSAYKTKINQRKLDRLKKKALLSFYLGPKHLPETVKAFASLSAIKKSLVKLKRF